MQIEINIENKKQSLYYIEIIKISKKRWSNDATDNNLAG